MPRETISANPNANVIQVAWGPHETVQVSTSCPTRVIASTLFIGGDGTPHVEEDTPFPGWWADLDRHALNRLIRTLRRARDAAYGKDE